MVFFRPRLTLSLVESHPGKEFRTSSIAYVDQRYGWLTGFFDRLYAESGTFVGIRYSPVREMEFLLKPLSRFAYTRLVEQRNSIDIFFLPVAVGRLESKGDQSFGDTIYAAASGELVLSFETEFLSADEIELIRSVDADWIKPESI